MNNMSTNRAIVKWQINVAETISMLFSPFLIPFWLCLALFSMTDLRFVRVIYQISLMSIFAFFTLILPVGIIWLYGKICHLSVSQMSVRKERFFPYLLTLICYSSGVVMLYGLKVPYYLLGIMLAASVVVTALTFFNYRWKFSAHSACMGSVVGCVVAYSRIFHFNPVWWLCAVILIAGLVGSSRLILKAHSLSEVVMGFIIGWLCTILVLHPHYNSLFQNILY